MPERRRLSSLILLPPRAPLGPWPTGNRGGSSLPSSGGQRHRGPGPPAREGFFVVPLPPAREPERPPNKGTSRRRGRRRSRGASTSASAGPASLLPHPSPRPAGVSGGGGAETLDGPGLNLVAAEGAGESGVYQGILASESP